MNYAEVYLKKQAQTRRDTLREELEGTLRDMRQTFDIIAKDFNNYPKEASEKLQALEKELSGIYQRMKAEGQEEGYKLLTEDLRAYILSRLNKGNVN
ncbi:MAG: hypothetical protein BWX78_01442 [Firmicutes bacterium ADurb.Bin099]|nr:MAG: hypothetical protein BWX78_01442 [Firmicutes bacterium ADurb.Bin099]